MLIIGLILSLGKFILLYASADSLFNRIPFKADFAISVTDSNEFGPIRHAFGLNVETILSSAAGRQSAIIKGLFKFDRCLILSLILCSVGILTEHVTIRLKSAVSGLSARVKPSFCNFPAIISISEKLAEHP